MLASRWVALALVLAASAAPVLAGEFDPWKESARYEFEYRVDIPSLAGRDGQRLRLWIPAPSSGFSQDVLDLRVEAPWPHRETRDRLGNRIVYLETEQPSEPARVALRFLVEREPHPGAPPSIARPGTPHDPALYRQPARRIPLNGLIRKIAVQESHGIEGAQEKIRAFYDYVVRTMTYSKQGEGWGQGDAIWACTSKYGNCTDFHSLFLGLARSQDISARFVIGFPIPADRAQGEIPGYHCWAEAYEPSRGWIPLDSSEAKKSGRTDAYFGQLPSDRIAFTVGRDLTLEPRQEGDLLNYFIYPYAELDGKPLEGLETRFSFRRVAVTRRAAHEGGGASPAAGGGG